MGYSFWEFAALILWFIWMSIGTVYFVLFKLIYLPIFDDENKINLNVEGPAYLKQGRLGRLSILAMTPPGTNKYIKICKKFKDDPFFQQYARLPYEKLKSFKYAYVLSKIGIISMLLGIISLKLAEYFPDFRIF